MRYEIESTLERILVDSLTSDSERDSQESQSATCHRRPTSARDPRLSDLLSERSRQTKFFFARARARAYEIALAISWQPPSSAVRLREDPTEIQPGLFSNPRKGQAHPTPLPPFPTLLGDAARSVKNKKKSLDPQPEKTGRIEAHRHRDLIRRSPHAHTLTSKVLASWRATWNLSASSRTTPSSSTTQSTIIPPIATSPPSERP